MGEQEGESGLVPWLRAHPSIATVLILALGSAIALDGWRKGEAYSAFIGAPVVDATVLSVENRVHRRILPDTVLPDYVAHVSWREADTESTATVELHKYEFERLKPGMKVLILVDPSGRTHALVQKYLDGASLVRLGPLDVDALFFVGLAIAVFGALFPWINRLSS